MHAALTNICDSVIVYCQHSCKTNKDIRAAALEVKERLHEIKPENHFKYIPIFIKVMEAAYSDNVKLKNFFKFDQDYVCEYSLS